MRQHLVALAMFASMLPIGVAQGQPVVQSQEGIALENQILQLQNQMQNMQSSGGSGNSSLGGNNNNPPPMSSGAPAADSSIVTNLLSQVQQLQSQVQTLNGQVDTLQNQVNTQHDATEKEIGDMKFQMSNGAATPGAPPNGPAPGPTVLTPPTAQAAAPSGSPAQILHQGQAAFDKHDYATAAAAAHTVLSTAGTSPEAYRAQYLLAQSLSAQGKPQDAAIAYDDAYNKSRTGALAPQSLLGLASSLASINQNEAACDTISSLNSQFPTPPAGMQARIDAVSHRAHCS
jgi:TolA-binding protein